MDVDSEGEIRAPNTPSLVSDSNFDDAAPRRLTKRLCDQQLERQRQQRRIFDGTEKELQSIKKLTITLPETPAPAPSSDVTVTIGTSAMMRKDTTLAGRISSMINEAYRATVPAAWREGYSRISEDEVEDRLAMGDSGPRANRVLHLAHRGEQLVGACSSTYQPPWTPEGRGHWGLVAVAPEAQGTGVASALVGAAERRLAAVCETVQIEYQLTHGEAASERLRSLYEGKYGFTCISERRRGGGGGGADEDEDEDENDPMPEPGETEFRRCVKELEPELRLRARAAHLSSLREALRAEVDAQTPPHADRIGSTVAVRGVSATHAGRALNGRRGEVLGWDGGRYLVRLEPSASEPARVGADAAVKLAPGDAVAIVGRRALFGLGRSHT